MEMKMIELVCLLVSVSAWISHSAKTDGVYYVFGGDGIDVVDPDTQSIVKHFVSNSSLCTKGSSRVSSGNCSFGDAVNFDNKYIVVTDSWGDRVHFIDVEQQKRVETITTDAYPYDIYYLPWRGEIWVHTWGSMRKKGVGGTFDVINVKQKKKTHRAIKAHIRPGWTHGFMVAHSFLQQGNFSYVTHYANPGIHKLDLVNKQYSDFVNLTHQDCSGTMRITYNSRIDHVFFQCFKNYKNNGLLELDPAAEKIVKKWDIKGRPYMSPDGRFLIALYAPVNETAGILLDSKVRVIEFPKAGPPKSYNELNIRGGVSVVTFGPSDGKTYYWAFISLLYSSNIVALDLESLSKGNVVTKRIMNAGYAVTGPGRHAVSRHIAYGANGQPPPEWLISTAPANKSVALVNIKDFLKSPNNQQAKMVQNIKAPKFSVWVGTPGKPTSATAKPSPFQVMVASINLLVVMMMLMK